MPGLALIVALGQALQHWHRDQPNQLSTGRATHGFGTEPPRPGLSLSHCHTRRHCHPMSPGTVMLVVASPRASQHLRWHLRGHVSLGVTTPLVAPPWPPHPGTPGGIARPHNPLWDTMGSHTLFCPLNYPPRGHSHCQRHWCYPMPPYGMCPSSRWWIDTWCHWAGTRR